MIIKNALVYGEDKNFIRRIFVSEMEK